MSGITLNALNDVGVVAIVLLISGLGAWAFKAGWVVWGTSHRSEVAIYQAAAERDASTIAALLATNSQNATTMAEWNVSGQIQASTLQALRDALEHK